MTSIAEKKFHDAMANIYNRAKQECGYNAGLFLKMLGIHGGLATAKRLLQSKEVQYGFTELWQCGRLDLTVEAHVLKPEFSSLFTSDEIMEAQDRLKQHGYFEKQLF